MDWRAHLESCRDAIRVLEGAEADVDRAFARLDRAALVKAEEVWNQRRIDAVKQIWVAFEALEATQAHADRLLLFKQRELEKLQAAIDAHPRPKPRSASPAMAVVLLVAATVFFAVMGLASR